MPFYRDTHMYLQECLGQGNLMYRHETFAKQFFVQKTGSGSAACWVAFRLPCGGVLGEHPSYSSSSSYKNSIMNAERSAFAYTS